MELAGKLGKWLEKMGNWQGHGEFERQGLRLAGKRGNWQGKMVN